MGVYPQGERIKETKQEAAEQGEPWIEAAKDDIGQGNETAPGRELFGDGAQPVDTQIGPGEPGQSCASHGGEVSQTVHRNTSHVCRLWIFTHGLQAQAE